MMFRLGIRTRIYDKMSVKNVHGTEKKRAKTDRTMHRKNRPTRKNKRIPPKSEVIGRVERVSRERVKWCILTRENGQRTCGVKGVIVRRGEVESDLG